MPLRPLFFALALALVARPAPAQPLPVQVDLDHAVFAYSPEASLVELYLAFDVTSFDYQATPDGFRARLPVGVNVLRSTDATLEGTPSDPVWQDATELNFVIADTTGLRAGTYFLHQTRTTLPPGAYELSLVVPADPATGRPSLELRRDLLVADFATGQTGLSDVTLASSIEQSADRDDVFYKNGLLIRPNANQLYGTGLDQLFYYVEAYGTEALADRDDRYTAYLYVAEANRPQPIEGLEKRLRREVRTPDVLVGAFDLSELPSGSYFLRIALLDERNRAVAEQARKFFVYNPDVARDEPVALEMSFEQSPYAVMSEEEVARGLEHVALIATDRERRRARSIEDLDERRRFLMDFWTKRDPQPSTPVNEFRDEFYRRLQYANERYANSFREGWKTDRGRTLVKYGTPAQIEPHLYEPDSEPYEIWQYTNIPGEGQAIFVFADRNGFNEFELIHSTVAGEPKMPSWQAEIRR